MPGGGLNARDGTLQPPAAWLRSRGDTLGCCGGSLRRCDVSPKITGGMIRGQGGMIRGRGGGLQTKRAGM